MLEFAGVFINPFEVATIKVRPFLNQDVMEVTIGMSSGEMLVQAVPPEAADDLVDTISTIVGGDIEELLKLDEDDEGSLD